MGSGKSEVMGVRVEPHVKAALQLAGMRTGRSLANVIEVMVATCCTSGAPLDRASEGTLATVISRKHP